MTRMSPTRSSQTRLSRLSLLLLVGLAVCAPDVRAQRWEGASRQRAVLDVQIGASVSALEQAQAAQARLETERAQLGARSEEIARTLRVQTRALYRFRRGAALRGISDLSSLLQRWSRLRRLEQMTRRQLASLEDLERRAGLLGERLEAASAALARAEGELSSLRAQQQLAQAEAQAQAVIETYRLPVAELPPVPIATGPGIAGGAYRILEPSSPPSRFARLEGRLPLPVSVRAELAEASREDGAGIELSVPPGTPVQAVADGRIGFKARQGARGVLVVVEHDGGYFTVYGGLASTHVRVGEPIARGAQLGRAGMSAPFFGVREGTRALDPRAWLGL